MDDFEWELSKENVQPLKCGRSVDVLNKALYRQRSNPFELKRQRLRQHFELKLTGLSPSLQKLRLYTKYVDWVEQNYPSLGLSADLPNLLYRCVRDTTVVDGIRNDFDYVKCWIKLAAYCDQPTELFELLFVQGIGTMCAQFYSNWADSLEKVGNLCKSAAVYAHGLRAGAKPLVLLEDRAESFVGRHAAYTAKLMEQKKCFYPFNETDNAINNTSTTINSRRTSTIDMPQTQTHRQQLAALKLIESQPGPDGITNRYQYKAPVMRTSEMWHSDQTGLPKSAVVQPVSVSDRLTSTNSNQQIRNNACVDRIYSDRSQLQINFNVSPTNRNFDNLIRPIVDPTKWAKENQMKPMKWTEAQIDKHKLQPFSVIPETQINWTIYKGNDDDDDSASQIAKQSADIAGGRSVYPGKSKGLKMKSSTNEDSDTPLISMSTFTRLLPISSDKTVYSNTLMNEIYGKCNTEQSDNVKHTEPRADLEKPTSRLIILDKLNLPSLPVTHLPADSIFYCSMDLIYGGAEECSWEMHRAINWNSKHQDVKTNCASFKNMDIWELEEMELIQEINTILAPLTTKCNAEEQPNDSRQETFASNRSELIRILEHIAANKSDHSDNHH